MEKFSLKSLLTIVVILLIGIVAIWRINQGPKKVEAGWFNEAWSYRKAITLTNSGTGQTNVYVALTIGTSDTSRFQADAGDIRFTKQNGELLPYYIVSGAGTSSTLIHINFDIYPAGASTFYLYYGNSSADNGFSTSNFTTAASNSSTNLLTEELSPAPIAYWSFNEGTGTTVYDSSPSQLDGKFYGNPTWKSDVDCISGNCLYFRGDKDGIEVNNNSKLNNTGATSIGMWIKPTTIDGSISLINRAGFTGPDNGYSFEIYDGKPSVTINNGRVSNSIQRCNQNISINNYYYLYWTRDESNNNKIYINGKECTYSSTIGITQVSTNTSLGIGSKLNKENLAPYSDYSNRNYNQMYDIGGWGGDDAEAYYYSSGGYNNLPYKKIIKTNGGTGGSYINDNAYFAIQDNKTYIISAYMKANRDENLNAHVLNINREADNAYRTSGSYNLSTNWQKYSWVYNSSIGHSGQYHSRHIIYVDNDLPFETYWSGFKVEDVTGTGQTTPSYDFAGNIDEVKIYNYARTATQIKQDYRAGLSGMKTQKGSSVAMGGSSGGKSLSDGLVGYWKMDENTGTVVGDSSGVGNTGTFATGDATPSWSSGKYGVGVSFDGVNDYINFGNPNLSSLTNATISFWRKGPSTPANWLLFQGQSSVYYIMATSGGTGNFYHSNAGGNKTIYVDGKVVLAPPSDNNWHHYVISGVNLSSWTTFLLNNYSNWHFKGAIDEIRLYNRALSYDEVRQLAEYAPGPVAYYDFEEGVGNVIRDKSGNQNNSVGWTGNPQWTTGKYGSALSFDGSSTIRTPTLNLGNNFTVSYWMKPTTLYNYGDPISAGTSDGYYTFVTYADGHMFNAIGNGSWGTSINPGTGYFKNNQWYHITGTYNNGSYTQLFVNGIAVGGTAVNTGYSINQPFNIGSRAGYFYYFKGLIDEVKIYNYARTQKQILQDMNASAPVGGMSKINKPIAHYKFDEGYGTVVNNSGSIGSTINGTFGPGTSAPTWVTGKSGKGLSFDGNDYVWLGNQSILSPNNITISSWFKVNADGTIIRNRTYGYNLRTSGNKVVAGLYENSNNQIQISSTMNINDNKWHQATMTYNGTALKLYIDGVYNNSTNGTGTNAIYYVEKAIAIGRDADNPSNHFNGLIDEVKIYNYALSEDEIKQDYNQGATAVIGKSTQTIGATTTSLDYCIPGDTSHCAAPIAEYNFEEGVGTTAYDKSGNGNHCYTSNSPLWVSGKTGGALQFNGSNQRCTKTGGVTIGQITAQAWVYRTSSTTNQGIIRQQNSFILSLKDDTIQLGGTSFLNTGITIPLNSWQHVAWTNNGNNNILFINGQEKWRNSGGTLPNNTNDLNVAYDNNNWWWGGKIDSVKIYNYARTPAQIAYDYNKGGPIGHWKMDECQGTIINDSSGLGNTGTLVIGAGGSQSSVGTCQSSGAWYNGRTGKINSAMSFDGTDDYINCGTNPNYIMGNRNHTLSAWVYPKAVISDYNYIFATGNDSGGEQSGVGIRSTSKIFLSSYSSSIVTTDYALPSINKWYHILMSYNGDTDTASFYVNGVFVESESITLNTTVGKCRIGTHTANNASFFNGLIDDVRIYNYALTAEQVKSVYNGGSINFR